jgi:DedD protein
MALPKPAELSATELELKRRGRRRLVGAIALGLVIVVFLPMLFDAEPKRDKTASRDISIQLPPKDTLPPLPAPAAPAHSMPAQGELPAINGKLESPDGILAPAAESASGKGVSGDVVVKGAASANSAPVEPPKSEMPSLPKAEGTESLHGFVVQIGAFKDAENAQQIVARMKSAKLPVFTDSVATKSGNVTRVRVGPFKRKEQADAALAAARLNGADGKIVPLP